ncbi:MAG: heme-binding protein [Planctomycetota bacterium]|nr:heme-binding protein [Planctomycetota bacterium]
MILGKKRKCARARHGQQDTDANANRICFAIIFSSLLLILLSHGEAIERQAVTKSTPVDRIGEIKSHEIHLPPNFFAEKIYSVPRETQGSWVALAIDPQGRLIASAQSKGLFRITPPPVGSGQSAGVEKIDLPIGWAQGLLHAFGGLYVVVNGQAAEGSGLYKVSDTDGDDRYDQVRLLRKFNGAGEHGPHSVVQTSDGKNLLVIGGNATDVPQCNLQRPPQNWGTDSILSTQNDSRGFGKHLKPPGGWVCRTDPEGQDWELVAIGFRNAYDLALNSAGEIFTFDSDNEWDMGMPWYRPTRVCHVCSGGEFGWRTGTGKWPAYRPDGLPAVVDVGAGSPTGMAFGYGTHFPERYQNALFLGDWSFGNIYAVHLTPSGASYEGFVESFASAVPLPVTDLVVRTQDGMLYFTTGGRGIESALYRIGYRDPEHPKINRPIPELNVAFAQRHALEALHRPADAENVQSVIDAAWPFLSNSDRHLRYAARLVLEHQPCRWWQTRALQESNPQALIQASIALCRAKTKKNHQLQQHICAALDGIEWSALRESEKIDLLRAYQLAIIRFGNPNEELRNRLLGRLNPLYPADADALNSELCQLLVALKSPVVVPRTLKLIATAKTQEAKIDYMLSLRLPGLMWTERQRQIYFQWFKKLQAYQGGESYDSVLKQIRKEASEHLTKDEYQSLGDLTQFNSKGSSLAESSAKPTARLFVKNWSVKDFEDDVVEPSSTQNLARGEILFSEVGCIRCHRIAGRGGILGPDLTTIGHRFTTRDLLEAILEPDRVISDQYRATTFTLHDGKQVTGQIADIHKGKWSVITNMLQPRNYTPVDPQAIEEAQPSPVSMMPSGLLDTLTREEILDLLSFLKAKHERS